MINLNKSKLRDKILAYYYNHPSSEFYIREIARIIAEDATNVLRELKRLELQGIFISEKKGKQKYYRLDSEYPLYNEFKSIVSKTIGIEKKLLAGIKDIKGIKIAFIYGSYASGKEKLNSDIDLFIIGKIEINDLIERINNIENEIGREVNFRIFSVLDYEKAILEKNSFLINILKNKKVFLISNEEEFKKIN